MVRNIRRYFVFVGLCFMISCSPSNKLVQIDEWEGIYRLKEYNSCCDSVRPVRLIIKKNVDEKYEWKMYWVDGVITDTVIGTGMYKEKKLKFFVTNSEIANRYFVGKINRDKLVFEMQYVNYYSDTNTMYIECYTKWANELKGYQSSNRLFAGIHFHFKTENSKREIGRTKNN